MIKRKNIQSIKTFKKRKKIKEKNLMLHRLKRKAATAAILQKILGIALHIDRYCKCHVLDIYLLKFPSFFFRRWFTCKTFFNSVKLFLGSEGLRNFLIAQNLFREVQVQSAAPRAVVKIVTGTQTNLNHGKFDHFPGLLNRLKEKISKVGMTLG